MTSPAAQHIIQMCEGGAENYVDLIQRFKFVPEDYVPILVAATKVDGRDHFKTLYDDVRFDPQSWTQASMCALNCYGPREAARLIVYGKADPTASEHLIAKKLFQYTVNPSGMVPGKFLEEFMAKLPDPGFENHCLFGILLSKHEYLYPEAARAILKYTSPGPYAKKFLDHIRKFGNLSNDLTRAYHESTKIVPKLLADKQQAYLDQRKISMRPDGTIVKPVEAFVAPQLMVELPRRNVAMSNDDPEHLRQRIAELEYELFRVTKLLQDI